MAVVIDSGPVEAEDLLRHVPREKWRELMLVRRRFMEIHLSHDCRCLVQFVNDAKLMHAELGFANAETMIRDGYCLELKEIEIAVEWLRLNPPENPISLDRTIVLAKREIGVEGGKPGPGRGHKTGANSTRFSDRGSTHRAYILARLDRDGHTELATKVRERTFSANAAAIKAGFRKKPTAFEQVIRLLPKLSDDEISKLLDLLCCNSPSTQVSATPLQCRGNAGAKA